MRFLKAIFLVVFLIGALPLEAFCNDMHEGEESGHSHCVLVCHSVCFHAIAVDQKVVATPESRSVFLLSSVDFSYQNPSLDTLKRPPVVLA